MVFVMNETTTNTTVILGGMGKTGRRVAQRLAAMGHPFRVASRSTPVPFDWNDESTWERALEGASALYITYFPDLAIPGAAEHVRRVSRLAVDRGVQRIVLLSGRGEPQSHPAQQAVRESGADFTILECAFFCQNFDEGLVAPIDGAIVFPGGDVAEPFIDCDDIAAVAVAALTDPRHAGKTYELTGPRALTFPEAVAAIASAAERPIRYVPVSFEDYREMLAPHMNGQTDFFIELFRFLLDGHNAQPADGVQQALGRPAREFGAYAVAAAGAWR